MKELMGKTIQIPRNTEDGHYTGKIERVNEEHKTVYVRVVESECERVDGNTNKLYAVGMSKDWSIEE